MKIILILILTITGYTNTPYTLRCAEDKVSGCQILFSFGVNNDLNSSTYESIWNQGGAYNWDTFDGGILLEIASDDNTDAEEITLVGLDSSWNRQTETLSLNGQTPVTSSNTYLRLYSAYNSDSVEFEGNVYVANELSTWSAGVPQLTTGIVAKLDPLYQQTTQAVYSTGARERLYIYNFIPNTNNTNEVRCILYVREFGGVFRAQFLDMVNDDSSAVITSAIPLVVPQKSDIDVKCLSISGTPIFSLNYNGLQIDY